MQKIIVTGGAGFIGSNFLSKFVVPFPEIQFINVDILTNAGNIEKIDFKARNSKNYFFEKVNICDFEELRAVFQKYKPTDIIHFAAESHVDISLKNPKIFTETNVIGTQNLLDLYREFGLRRFHYISTDEVYGDGFGKEIFTENTNFCPSNPYSASKAAAEMLVMAYGRTFGVDYVISRSSNNFGPNQNFSSFIPLFIQKILNNEKVPLYGDGSQIRDWIFVEDHCDAIFDVFRFAKAKSVYNIGANNPFTNLEITKMLLQILGKSEDLIDFVVDRPGHDKCYRLDISKIQTELHWSAKTDFAIGLQKTVDFYKNFLGK